MALTKIDDRGLKTPIDLLDDEKIRLGTGNDLEIYHNGSNSFIKDTGTGALAISGSQVSVDSSDSSEYMIKATENAAVELYYNGSKKLQTTANGIEITAAEGGSAGLYLTADEGDDNGDKWSLYADDGSTISLVNYASGSWEKSIECNGNGNVELYHDNSKKLETNSTGVHVTGMVTCTTEFRCDDNEKFVAGTGQDLQIYHDGTDSIISHQGGTSGDLILQTTGSDDDVFIKCNDDFIVNVQGGAENAIIARNNGAVELYNDNVKVIETNTTGIQVGFDGAVSNPTIKLPDDGYLTWGTSDTAYIQGADAGSGGYIKFNANNGQRVRIDGDGLKFGTDTAAANALDDYEEGNWTPTDGSGASLTLTNNYTATYVKIGRFVHLQFDVSYPSTSDTNDAQLSGLPFNLNVQYGSGIVGWTNLDRTGVYCHIGTNNTVYLMDNTSSGSSSTQHLDNNEVSGKRFIGMATYYV